ncbi:GTP cyclohydrolase I [Limnothrix redekei]|uniref:GTP cyclohydrolase I n=1 Tax=Limnothrix redekei LRLZ20PSL1 TaxID=3112953 RepID=A0ABW7CCU1_9CYAN
MINDESHPERYLFKWLSSFLDDQDIRNFHESICGKPGRITNAYEDLFQGSKVESAEEIIKVTEFLKGDVYQGLVSGLNIPFLSFCSHHFLPFHGTVDLIYEPGEYIIGIGKLSRLVDYRAKRFNIQERIAEQLCSDLMQFGLAKGAFARVKASHMCLCHRGPQKYNSTNTVCYWTGSFLDSSKKIEVQQMLS